MKNLLAIIGSPRKNGRTNKIVKMFVESINNYAKTNVEYIYLCDYNILTCKGCELCLKKGEEFCPLDDHTAFLYNKIINSDGVIIASPNYALQVSSLTKIFLDRLAFIFHRPCFFHKAWIPIVVQGAYGGKEITKYLNNVGKFWGFNTCKGINLTLPVDNVIQENMDKIKTELDKKSKLFCKLLDIKNPVVPSTKQLCIFRLSRTFHDNNPSKEFVKDYIYYKENGWFSSQYYYNVRLNIFKRIIANIVDKFAIIQNRKR
jgi:multimeric flavodoxin WrbA